MEKAGWGSKNLKRGNFLKEIPDKISKKFFTKKTKELFLPEKSKESFIKIIQNKNCKIEKIISMGHKTPKGKWYNQNKNEFVMILKGSAELLFFPDKKIKMKTGDYINIPAHLKHRVDKTSKKTIWLAVFY